MKNFFLGIKKLALEQSRTYSSSREKSFSRITKKQKFSQKTKKRSGLRKSGLLELSFAEKTMYGTLRKKYGGRKDSGG